MEIASEHPPEVPSASDEVPVPSLPRRASLGALWMRDDTLSFFGHPRPNLQLYERLRLPGAVARAPPGTPFRVAGAALRREVTYDARGRATLHVLADGRGGAAVSEGVAAGRARFEQQMMALPVLLVLPPRALEQQRYTRDAADAPAAGGLAAASVAVGASCDERGSLRAAVWGGCEPPHARAAAWRLLHGTALPALARQHAELARRREAYASYTRQYFTSSAECFYAQRTGGGGSGGSGGGDVSSVSALLSSQGSLAAAERAVLQQITLDLPRHRPALFHAPATSAGLARCLFMWSLRHPSAGYVQGMDDLAAVCYLVFLAAALQQAAGEAAGAPVHADSGEVLAALSGGPPPGPPPPVGECRCAADVLRVTPARVSGMTAEELSAALAALPAAYLAQAEADTYWALSQLLSSLQDSYIAGQPGIQHAAAVLSRVVAATAPRLHAHMAAIDLRLADACFPWLHCLFAREFPVPALLALWDCYFAVSDADARAFPEGGSGVMQMHIFTAAALLRALQPTLLAADMPTALRVLRSPYEAVFPPLEAAEAADPQRRRRREQQEHTWLQTLIADAYSLWRTFPAQSRSQ